MPAWSPDGTRIVFASRDRGKDFEISVVSVTDDLLGIQGEILKLTDNDFDDLHPTWSPDGSQIAFRSNHNDQVDIYVIKADGSSIPKQLTHNREIDQDRAPTWRPGGTILPDEDGP